MTWDRLVMFGGNEYHVYYQHMHLEEYVYSAQN